MPPHGFIKSLGTRGYHQIFDGWRARRYRCTRAALGFALDDRPLKMNYGYGLFTSGSAGVRIAVYTHALGFLGAVSLCPQYTFIGSHVFAPRASSYFQVGANRTGTSLRYFTITHQYFIFMPPYWFTVLSYSKTAISYFACLTTCARGEGGYVDGISSSSSSSWGWSSV